MDDERTTSRPLAASPESELTRLGLVFAIVAGIVVATSVQLTVGWWLDSGQGVAVTTRTSFVVSLVLFRARYDAAAFWAALNVANVVILFWNGPGNIFPIVIVIGAVLTGAAVAAGWSVRWGLEHGWSLARQWLRSA